MRWTVGSFLVLAAACRSASGAGSTPVVDAPGSGEVSVEWRKGPGGAKDTVARFTAPAEARWCAADTLLEVLAIRNDTAFGLSLLPADTLGPATYSMYSARVPLPWRPQALAALRYLTEFANVGFDALGGQVTVTDGNSRRVSGTIEARLRQIDGRDSVRVTGRFTSLGVRPATGSCGRAGRPRAR